MWIKKDNRLTKIDNIELTEYKGRFTIQTTYNTYTIEFANFENKKKANDMFNKIIEAIKNKESVFEIK